MLQRFCCFIFDVFCAADKQNNRGLLFDSINFSPQFYSCWPLCDICRKEGRSAQWTVTSLSPQLKHPHPQETQTVATTWLSLHVNTVFLIQLAVQDFAVQRSPYPHYLIIL